MKIAVVAVLVTLLVTAFDAPARVLAQDKPATRIAPKLVVLISVDQMRGDYVDRFHHQWTKGLNRLVTEGAWFRQADYPVLQHRDLRRPRQHEHRHRAGRARHGAQPVVGTRQQPPGRAARTMTT